LTRRAARDINQHPPATAGGAASHPRFPIYHSRTGLWRKWIAEWVGKYGTGSGSDRVTHTTRELIARICFLPATISESFSVSRRPGRYSSRFRLRITVPVDFNRCFAAVGRGPPRQNHLPFTIHHLPRF